MSGMMCPSVVVCGNWKCPCWRVGGGGVGVGCRSWLSGDCCLVSYRVGEEGGVFRHLVRVVGVT